MTRYEYDEEASQWWHMDVVHETDERPTPVARWVDAMRRLSSIDDPLPAASWRSTETADPVVGACDSGFEHEPIARRLDWGCETTSVIANHFGVDYPAVPPEAD